MDIITIFTILGVSVAFIGMLAGWLIMLFRDRKKRETEALKGAYEKGSHDQEHKKITTQLDATHDKIRKNGADIASINGTLTGHTKVHERLLSGQEAQQKSLGQIQQILMDGNK